MKMQRFLLSIGVLLLTACGGGGGGGEGEDAFGVRVLHGALEFAPVEYADPNKENGVLSAKFLEPNQYSRFPEGSYLLNLYRKNSGLSRFVTSVNFEILPRTRQTVVFFGDDSGSGPNALSLVDEVPEMDGGKAMLRVVNSVVGISQIEFQDVVVPYGRASSYLAVNAGEFTFSPVRSDIGSPLGGGVFLLEEQVGYTVVVAGRDDIFVESRIYRDSR